MIPEEDLTVLPDPKTTQFDIISTLLNHSLEIGIVFVVSILIASYFTNRNSFLTLIIAFAATAIAAGYFVFSTLTSVKF